MYISSVIYLKFTLCLAFFSGLSIFFHSYDYFNVCRYWWACTCEYHSTNFSSFIKLCMRKISTIMMTTCTWHTHQTAPTLFYSHFIFIIQYQFNLNWKIFTRLVQSAIEQTERAERNFIQSISCLCTFYQFNVIYLFVEALFASFWCTTLQIQIEVVVSSSRDFVANSYFRLNEFTRHWIFYVLFLSLQ